MNKQICSETLKLSLRRTRAQKNVLTRKLKQSSNQHIIKFSN